MFTTWMCDPNPITLLDISFLKPVTMATATIITASPNAMPNVAIPTMELENLFRSPLCPMIRLAMNSSVFKMQLLVDNLQFLVIQK